MRKNELSRIRAEAPLVHNLTSCVMNSAANALLRLGARYRLNEAKIVRRQKILVA